MCAVEQDDRQRRRRLNNRIAAKVKEDLSSTKDEYWGGGGGIKQKNNNPRPGEERKARGWKVVVVGWRERGRGGGALEKGAQARPTVVMYLGGAYPGMYRTQVVC